MPVHHAFVDESGRGTNYYVCAAVCVADDVQQVRQLARGFLLPGQRRWHFTGERASRRRQILSGIVQSGQVIAMVAYGKGDSEPVRAACLERLAAALVEHRTHRVVIESRANRDAHDRTTLAHVLAGVTRPFEYVHHLPRDEPGLWLADAVAWSYSAGGSWRQDVSPIVRADFDLDNT